MRITSLTCRVPLMVKNIHWKKMVVLRVFIIVHFVIAYNFYFLSKDTINGDFSGSRMLVKPRYDFMRIPVNDLTKECHAENRLSGDFAQVYFPARVSSPKTYSSSESPSPWHNPSRYAPFMHTVCHYTLCNLQYGYASFLNILIQLLMLYLSFVIAYRTLHIEKFLLPSILLVNICLFLTPVGLSWFERGQFSVFVTLAYLWLSLGIIKRNPYYLVLSALFAYLKWTSFPFVCVAVSLWILNSKSLKELKGNIRLAILVPATFAILFLFNIKEGVSFVNGLYVQESTFKPAGLSLLFLLPRYWVKALPLILVVLGYLYIWKIKADFAFLMPYLTAVGILSMLYPTLAYDYSVPCLLCFIPLLIYWAELIKNGRGTSGEIKTGISSWCSKMQEQLPVIIVYFFCVYLLVASSCNAIFQFYKWPGKSAVYVSIASALMLMGSLLISYGVKKGEM